MSDTAVPGILLVEDDANDVLLIRRALKKIGSADVLRVVSEVDQAIAYLDGRGKYDDRGRFPSPSLVLVDLKLPGKSGFEFLVWLRSHEKLRRLPATVLSSSHQESDVSRAYELGANSYLVKPQGFDSLVDLMESVVRYWLTLNVKPRRED